MKFSIIIPVLNGGAVWESAAQALKNQSITPERILVIDSGSTDNSLETTKNAGFDLISIESDQFDHGATRQMGVDLLLYEEVVVFLTQDAILKNEDAIKILLDSFSDPDVAAAYGRQLPREEAGIIEAYARRYNYPEISSVKTQQDIPRLGIKTAFCSNSFAAYRVEVLKKMGGFPPKTIFAEDMIVCAKMLLAGFKVAYCAQALCIHSHDYTITQEFRRSFDIGVFHAREYWILAAFGNAESEGKKYIFSLLKVLFEVEPNKIPFAMLFFVAKIMGYKLGRIEKQIPACLKAHFSLNKKFWKFGE
jgi:rhamnosyltransferase